jgi:3-hydroxyacyl-CoA dehydrogenase
MQSVAVRIADGVALAVIENPPVNALNVSVRTGIMQAVDQARQRADIRAMVLAAKGRTFVAGADITEFGKPPLSPTLREVIAALDESVKPIVAAINGAALGGGLELALACHARIASPRAKLGLPEVKLGLLPGAGGTQRLPRLIGAATALEMIAEGEPISAQRALELGLIDAIVEDDLQGAAIARARELTEAGISLRRTRDLSEQLSNPEERERFEAVAADVLKRSRGSPAPAACVEAVRAALDQSFDDGLAVERQAFERLLQDERSQALRHVFFAERASARIPDLSKDTPQRSIRSAAVIGAGTMGGGIAMCFAQAGIPVAIIETSQEALDRGQERIAQTYASSVKRGSLSAEDAQRFRDLMSATTDFETAADADIVVEAAFEDMAVKKQIFGDLDRIARPGAILATNTSYLDLNEIAAATARAEDVVGLHFFSPANVMRLLEIVRGQNTAPDVLATSVALGQKLGKIPVVVGVCYGFVGNRMLAQRTREAERLLLEGALPHEVDAALVAFGFRMGPFAVSDLAGLDISWRIRKAQGQRAPVADALCEAGRLGQKTGKGYYSYEQDPRKPTRDPAVEQLIAEVSEKLGIARRSIGKQEIVERLIFPMINEGARILEEGIAARPGDIDVIWINGYGWPAWRGGPMWHADRVGLPYIEQRLQHFAGQTGELSLAPAPLLQRLAAAGAGFASLKTAA